MTHSKIKINSSAKEELEPENEKCDKSDKEAIDYPDLLAQLNKLN